MRSCSAQSSVARILICACMARFVQPSFVRMLLNLPYSVFYLFKKKSPRHALGRLGRARDHDAWRPSSHTLSRRLASCHRDPTCTPHVWARGVAVALQCTHEINNAQALTTPAPFLRFLWAKLTTTTATRSSSSGYSAWGTNSHGSKCGQHVLSPEITWCSVRWS